MQDHPTYHELLEAVQHFIETDVIPVLDGPKKFHARVAANVLAIVRRELETEDDQLRAEWAGLDDILEVESPPAGRVELRKRLHQRAEHLCDRIRGGEADSGAWRAAVLAHVRQTVVAKLQVANPKYLNADVSSAAGS